MGNSIGRRRINRAQRHIREDKLGDWDHNTLYKFMKLPKIKNSIFSHSLCIMDVTLYLLSSLSKPTLCISCLHAFHPTCGRSAADLGFGEAGERWVLFLIFSLWCITSNYPEAVCAVLSLGDSHFSCLELPWFSGLGSRTALIQFTMQLHNCSQSPVDLDVK